MSVSRKEKKIILEGLKNEVGDFHPLLNELLWKLARVKRVDYTHGTNEKGADFVVTRDDDTLGDVEYIGVVVKTGKITTDLTKIEQQIDECELSRYTLNGKKNIHVEEIWVVTNESISKNSEEKIHHKFRSKKIKFIKNSDLIRLIDEHLPSFWGINNLPVAKYLECCSSLIDVENVQSSLVPRSSKVKIRIELTSLDQKYEKKKTKPEKPALLIDLVDKYNFVVVEGSAGSGKSQLIRDTIKAMCDTKYYTSRKYIPTWVSYTDLYKNHELDLSALLASKEFSSAVECQGSDDGTLVVFIDGVDELLLDGRDIKKELMQLHSSFERINNLKVVVSSRSLNLGNYRKILSGCVAYEVSPMSLKQVVSALKDACDGLNISDRLWNDIRDSDLFKQIPKNPISTLLLAQILSDNGQDLPSNLTDVYSRYISIMLGSWDIDKGLQSRKEADVATSILSNMSDYFINNDLPCIGRDEALGFFVDYLSVRNTGVEPEYLFEKVLSRSGILIEDRNGRICFKHRSFTEYLYALKKKDEYDDSFVDGRVYNALWRTIYFFYVGLHKDCEGLLSKIIAIEPQTPNERFWRFINLPNYFLAGYSTPYEIVEKTMPTLFIEARELYSDIVEGKVDSPFSQMPEIFILLFFQAASSSCYAYNFFIKSLEETAYSLIDCKKLSREDQAYTLLFVASVFQTLRLPNPFDGLLEEFSRDMPTAIRLSLCYKSVNVKSHSTLLKRNEKWVRQEMKKNPQLRAYYQKIMDVPVGAGGSLK